MRQPVLYRRNCTRIYSIEADRCGERTIFDQQISEWDCL